MMKCLYSLLTTLYDPEYGTSKGFRSLSVRSHTWVDVLIYLGM